MQKSSESV